MTRCIFQMMTVFMCCNASFNSLLDFGSTDPFEDEVDNAEREEVADDDFDEESEEDESFFDSLDNLDSELASPVEPLPVSLFLFHS